MDRYKELLHKERKGTLTDDEAEEMFQMEQESIQEDCMRMCQLGI